MNEVLKNKGTRLFILLGTFFIANALIAEFIGIKIFSLEKTFGFLPANISFFGVGSLSFDLTAGVLLWPVVFVMTDVINEYFGKRGVRMLSFIAVGLISYAFFMFLLGIELVPAEWWPASSASNGVEDMDVAFRNVFGQSLWIIVGSLVAFLIGQLVDVVIFQKIKKITGEKKIWLRATGSTLVSQFIDSFVVLFIAFYIGQGWALQQVLAIGLINYIYKFVMAILLTPAIYGMHHVIDKYLGHELAHEMKRAASGNPL